MDKKTPDPKTKAGVKFTDQKREVTPDANQIIKEKLEDKPKIVLDPETCKTTVIKIYNDADTNFKLSAKNDPDVKRKDTARALCKILDTLKEALAHLSSQNSDSKEKLYYLTYNGTIYTYEICRALRKSVYSSLAIQYIANSILSLEKNMILRSEKYLDWRVKLYIELAHTYEDCESYKASAKTIETAIGKVEKIKAYHDSDPPVPEHINVIVTNNLRILKALDIKYKLHTGVITSGDAWKKKIEEYFKNDVDGRNITIIESLNPNYKKHSNIVGHVGKTLSFFPWKEQIFDMIKNDTELLAKALDQLNEKMKMTIAIKEDMTLTEEGRYNLVQKVREFDNTMILEREWKKASSNVPIELHIEIIKHAYDVGSVKAYSELLQTALVRCNFRRIEVPYISDIDIQFSTIPNSNIPNGYEKIAIDINDSHLKSELAKLRLSIAKEIARQQEEKRQEKIKEQQMNKKAGKKPEPIEDGPKPPHPNSIQVDPLSVAHNYIYFLIKRSYSPERAIYAIDIVLADPEKGPVDKIAEGWVVKAIKIDQYTGVKETSGFIPWLCLKHSEESLKNEDEKKSLLIDFAPQLAKSYLARPPFGFEKINCDLRQIPREFYKLQNMDYVYVNYKMDRMYYICERELYILKALDELEKSYKGSRVTTDDEELKSHLDVNFDMEKFKELAKYTKKALDGPLGDYFFDARKDFLIKYGFYIWKKYLMSSLHQIDTLYELRLTEELSGDDFRKYEGILYNAKVAYAEMLEAISKILMKTDAIDPIWLIKINIELCKLLEEFGEYRKASQICRFAYNKLIEFKDKWFNRGVESKRDVFLPMTITCNNIEIHKMIEEMKSRYADWKTWLRKEVRSQNRQTNGKKPLEEDEAIEEDYEFIEASRVFYGADSLKDHKNLDTLTNEKAFTEYIATINALQH